MLYPKACLFVVCIEAVATVSVGAGCACVDWVFDREQVPGGTCRTLHVRHQLTGHISPIDAMCFNTFRNQVLTADRYTLRLWSLRKEIKRVNRRWELMAPVVHYPGTESTLMTESA